MSVLSDTDALAREFAQICSTAGVAVMDIYNQDFDVSQKSDRSPVTAADVAAEEIILEALAKLVPGVPVLAEESFEAGLRPSVQDEFILVDPVDGTKEFISKNGEFTINIALVSNGGPVSGAVYAPARSRLYFGGTKAFRTELNPGGPATRDASPIRVRPRPASGLAAVMSRSHADEQTLAFATAQGVTDKISAGSSLKFCLLAQGDADLYPRFGPTKEWDTGAGHAVLNAAGGRVLTPEGSPFIYGKTETEYLSGPFVADTLGGR